MRLALLLTALLTAAVPMSAPAAGGDDHPRILERPALLQALDGAWVMTGDVMGDPVTYRAEAGPTLQGAFTELHMDDVQVPSQYEARVVLGVDPETGVVIAHWMDSFGAAYSIPHGTGTLDGDTIRFEIPYAGGTFRDTLRHDAATGTWRFEIEAAQPDGTWKHFAAYDMRRP